MKRASQSAFLFLCVIALLGSAGADIKIKTRSSAMGHSSESTVYIKGSRQRDESGDNVTLTQCDKHRMVMLDLKKKTFMVMPMGESSPQAAAMQAGVAAQAAKGAPRQGGVVTITNANSDTGERQKMFGFDARHIRSTMIMESTPNACYPMNMKMESDGWYANLSPGLMCYSGSQMGAAMGAMARPDCVDQRRFRTTGPARLGYPLKVTTTMQMPMGSMTSTSEVTELSTATLPDELFDIPADFRQVGLYSKEAVGQASVEEAAPAEAAAPAPAAPAAAPVAAAPAAPPKAEGVVRVGVVTLSDQTNQSLPTDNLRDLLMGEIRNRQVDAVPLDASGDAAILEEARSKSCDYILYTGLAQLDDSPEARLPAALKSIAVSGQGKYLGRVDWKLYRTGRTVPQLATSEASRADDLAVNAVGDSVIKEAAATVEEIRNPHKAAPAAAPTKPPVRRRPK